jgi:hypothetical protein
MAGSAHAYVRGNTLKFYEAEKAAGKVQNVVGGAKDAICDSLKK